MISGATGPGLFVEVIDFTEGEAEIIVPGEGSQPGVEEIDFSEEEPEPIVAESSDQQLSTEPVDEVNFSEQEAEPIVKTQIDKCDEALASLA